VCNAAVKIGKRGLAAGWRELQKQNTVRNYERKLQGSLVEAKGFASSNSENPIKDKIKIGIIRVGLNSTALLGRELEHKLIGGTYEAR
jgi:hypothetical protein